MVSERDLFKVSGPGHLTPVNWGCPHHRRSVAASLVQGAYVLQRDRQLNRQGPEVRAPPWWEFFQFELIRKLEDDVDFSIFGAIYEFRPHITPPDSVPANAPRFVIAFRGTINKKGSFSRDLKLDLGFIRNRLHNSSRFQIAMQAVQNIVSAVGHQNIWMAGHSLGSAMAMLAGKNMAKVDIHLQSFLFNPPFVAAPLERIKDKKVKQGIRIANSLITAGLAVAVKGRRQKSEDSFTILSSWIPHLFVNPADGVCSEYIGYFEHRKKMDEIGAGNIGRLATQNSIFSVFGKESEALHLLPSANLIINLSPSPDFKRAHGIHQWWRPDLHLQSQQHRYK